MPERALGILIMPARSSRHGARSTTRNDRRKDLAVQRHPNTRGHWQRSQIHLSIDSSSRRYSRRGDVGPMVDIDSWISTPAAPPRECLGSPVAGR